MSGELSLVVPGGDDDSLAGVGGQAAQHHGATLATGVGHLHIKQ